MGKGCVWEEDASSLLRLLLRLSRRLGDARVVGSLARRDVRRARALEELARGAALAGAFVPALGALAAGTGMLLGRHCGKWRWSVCGYQY